MEQQALDGYKVLDFTHHIAGPYCTKLLAGLGAEVIKVEKPGEGDPSRRMGPFCKDDPHPEKSLHFLHLNTGKKSVTLNLKSSHGKKICMDLVREADLVVENFHPRVMPSLGLDYAALRAIHPRLIMTSISNFGQTGPYRDFKAMDINSFALSGTMYANGDPGREPLTYPGWTAQYWGGMNAFTATLVALYYREASGHGQYIDISIQECVGTLLENTDIRYRFAGNPHPRWGNRWAGVALWGARQCKDGWCCVVSGSTAQQWGAVVELLGEPALKNENYVTVGQRMAHCDEIEALAAPRLMELTKEEVFHRGQALGAATSPSMTAQDVFDSPQLRERGFWTRIDHPVVGSWPYPGAPVKMSETPFVFGSAPLLGQHNEDVYGRLGYGAQDRVRLREAGVI